MSRRSSEHTLGYGFEPIWDIDLTEVENPEEVIALKVPQLLNWYSLTKDAKDAKKYFINYLVEIDEIDTEFISFIDSYPDRSFRRSVPWLMRIVMKAKTKTPDFFQEKIKEHIAALRAEKLERDNQKELRIVEEEPTKPKGLRWHLLSDFLECLYNSINRFVNGSTSIIPLKFFEWFQLMEFTKEEVEHTLLIARKHLDEYKLSLTDDDFKEAYDHIKLTHRKLIVEYYTEQIQETEKSLKMTSSGKKTVAKRKRKVIPANVVKRLKFLRTHENMTSVSPVKLVGAKLIVLFNTKNRLLQVYQSKIGDTMTVKGSSIQNFDEHISFGKTLRKPTEFIPTILELPKTKILAEVGKITTKEKKLTGRVNSDTLILVAL